MTQRLTVNAITSIGAVEDGDDPEARIMFWKARKDSPDSAALGGDVLPPRVSRAPRGRGSLPITDIGPTYAQLSAEVSKLSKEYRDRNGGRTMAEQRTSAEVLAEVNALAGAIKKVATDPMTAAESRVEVWKAHPQLQVEVRKAQEAESKAWKAEAAWIDGVVKAHCLAISAERDNMTKTLSQIRRELMASAVGVEIQKLRNAVKAGTDPRAIAKSAEHGDAWRILKKWEAETQ
jgi:hypothetical protein